MNKGKILRHKYVFYRGKTCDLNKKYTDEKNRFAL